MEIKRRHKVFYTILYLLAGPIVKWVMRYRCDKMKNPPGPAMVVSNHTTNLDPALVALSFPMHLYFVASEHVTRWGLFSRLLRFVFGPIIRVKGKTDAKVGMQILRTLRAGESICVFGEGNRSYNGLTGPVYPATGKLAKAGGTTLITYRIEGGYFVAPRWGKKMRKGPIYGRVMNVYTPEQQRGMSSDEVNAAIQRDIGEDAYARQAETPKPYRGKALAEHLECALYLCPTCDGLGTLHSKGNGFACTCGLHGTYNEYGTLQGTGFNFTTVRDWDLWQQGETPRLSKPASPGNALCIDEGLTLSRLALGRGATALAGGRVALYPDRLDCAGHVFPLASISDLAIVNRQTLTFGTTEGPSYEITSTKPFSALKYQRLFNALKGTAQSSESQAT